MSSVREQQARLRAANRTVIVGNPELFAAHEQAGVLEQVFTCTGCGAHVAVGPCWEHIDPAGFVGAACGCLTPELLPMGDGPDGGDNGEGRAGTGQQTSSDGDGRSCERAMEPQGSGEGAR